MDIERARHWITTARRMFRVLPEPPEIVPLWAALVEKSRVTGFRAHDARYVAMMQAHGINRLMTYNVKHFAAYSITIIDPAAAAPTN